MPMKHQGRHDERVEHLPGDEVAEDTRTSSLMRKMRAAMLFPLGVGARMRRLSARSMRSFCARV